MGMPQRVLLAVAIVVIDAVVFVVPLAALFMAYVILANPPWVHDFMNRLSGPPR